MTPIDRMREERGQALALMVISLTTILLAIAVTIDGGHAFQEQRDVQNGSDGASLAGAVKVGDYAACKLWSCALPTDADVEDEVNAKLTANEIDTLWIAGKPLDQQSQAYYTDVCGTPLKENGEGAVRGNSINLSDPNIAKVGGGVIPPDIGGSANCASLDTGPVRGVLVIGHRTTPTFIAGMIGINDWQISTPSTAVSMYGSCAASSGCGLLPIAFPTNIVSCDNNNDPVDSGLGPYLMDTVYIIPLCDSGPGNVGWLDWTPKGGGVSPIDKPDNSPISFPSWQYVAQTGKPGGQNLQPAIRALGGTVARAVQFDYTCGDDQPNSSQPTVSTPDYYGCSQAEFNKGNGSNLWYRLPRMLGFIPCDGSAGECMNLEGAYIQGNQKSVCDTGNGATQCLVGKFVELGDDFLGGGGKSPVQLIK